MYLCGCGTGFGPLDHLTTTAPAAEAWRCSANIFHNRRRSPRFNLNGTATVEQTSHTQPI